MQLKKSNKNRKKAKTPVKSVKNREKIAASKINN